MKYKTKFTVIYDGEIHDDEYLWSSLEQAQNEVTSLAEWYGPDLLFVSITKLGDA